MKRSAGTNWKRAILAGKRWNAGVARGAVAAWEESGLSLAAFARLHGLPSAQRLAWWRKQLAQRGEDVTQIVRAAPERGALAPLVPVSVRGVGGSVVTAAIAVTFDDMRVEVSDPATTDPSWVADLVGALRGERR